MVEHSGHNPFGSPAGLEVSGKEDLIVFCDTGAWDKKDPLRIFVGLKHRVKRSEPNGLCVFSSVE